MHISESGDSFLSEDNLLMSRFDTAFTPPKGMVGVPLSLVIN